MATGSATGRFVPRGNGIVVDHGKPLKSGRHVYQGKFRDENVAVKRIDFPEEDEAVLKGLMKLRSHSNVVKYLAMSAWESTEQPGLKYIYTAMEMCDTDTIREIAKRSYTPEVRLDMLRQFTNGLCHLHENKVVHGGLKPSNVLRSLNGKEIKISDMGIHSTRTGHSGMHASPSAHWVPLRETPSEKTDVYSAGWIYYYILSGGKRPNKNPKASELSGFDTSAAYTALDLIKQMTAADPNNRPSAMDCSDWPLFWDEDRRLRFLCKFSVFVTQPQNATIASALREETIEVVGVVAVREIPPKNREVALKVYDDMVAFQRRFSGREDFANPSKILDVLKAIKSPCLSWCCGEKTTAKTSGLLACFGACFPKLLATIYNTCIRYKCLDDVSRLSEADLILAQKAESEREQDFVPATMVQEKKKSSVVPATDTQEVGYAEKADSAVGVSHPRIEKLDSGHRETYPIFGLVAKQIPDDLVQTLKKISLAISEKHDKNTVLQYLGPESIECSVDGSSIQITDIKSKDKLPHSEGLTAPGAVASKESNIFDTGKLFQQLISINRCKVMLVQSNVPAKLDYNQWDFAGADLAKHLVSGMLSDEASKRPTIRGVLQHPFFWSKPEKLEFFCAVSKSLNSELIEKEGAIIAEWNSTLYLIDDHKLYLKRLCKENITKPNKWTTVTPVQWSIATIIEIMCDCFLKYGAVGDPLIESTESVTETWDFFSEYFERPFVSTYNHVKSRIDEMESMKELDTADSDNPILHLLRVRLQQQKTTVVTDPGPSSEEQKKMTKAGTGYETHWEGVIEENATLIRIADCEIEFQAHSFEKPCKMTLRTYCNSDEWPEGYTGITPTLYVKSEERLLKPAAVKMTSWCSGLGADGGETPIEILHKHGNDKWEVVDQSTLGADGTVTFHCTNFCLFFAGLVFQALSRLWFGSSILLSCDIYAPRKHELAVFLYKRSATKRREIAERMEVKVRLPLPDIECKFEDRFRMDVACTNTDRIVYNPTPRDFKVEENLPRISHILYTTVMKAEDQTAPMEVDVKCQISKESDGTFALEQSHVFKEQWSGNTAEPVHPPPGITLKSDGNIIVCPKITASEVVMGGGTLNKKIGTNLAPIAAPGGAVNLLQLPQQPLASSPAADSLPSRSSDQGRLTAPPVPTPEPRMPCKETDL